MITALRTFMRFFSVVGISCSASVRAISAFSFCVKLESTLFLNTLFLIGGNGLGVSDDFGISFDCSASARASGFAPVAGFLLVFPQNQKYP